jgi:uncharacterized membrane protein YhaH (DUF805 family)
MPRFAGMESFAQFFSPSGRTARNPFVLGAVLVYVLIVASHLLLGQPVMTRSGVAPFALVQVALTYAWYALHARRLSDAGHGTGSALAIAILYCLGVVLFMLLASFVSVFDAGKEGSALAFLLVSLLLVALLSGDPSPLVYVALVFLIVIFTPLLIAFGFSIWVGTRPPLPAENETLC